MPGHRGRAFQLGRLVVSVSTRTTAKAAGRRDERWRDVGREAANSWPSPPRAFARESHARRERDLSAQPRANPSGCQRDGQRAGTASGRRGGHAEHGPRPHEVGWATWALSVGRQWIYAPGFGKWRARNLRIVFSVTPKRLASLGVETPSS